VDGEKWLEEDEAEVLLSHFGPDKLSQRQLRLLAITFVRQELLPIPAAVFQELEGLVALVEAIADSDDASLFATARHQLDRARETAGGWPLWYPVAWALGALPWSKPLSPQHLWGDLVYQYIGSNEGSGEWWEMNGRISGLIREIANNPFCSVAFSPSWRTDTVLALAQQMYQSRDFGAMPILADALQDAGCDRVDVLDHCRGPGPHMRGCWVVDLVLGKE
jgi:hypothetical protein